MNETKYRAVAVAVLVVTATAWAGIGGTGVAVADFGPADAAVDDEAMRDAAVHDAAMHHAAMHGMAAQDDSPPVSGESSLGDADTTFLGTSEDDRAGTAVAGVGDVNGDGTPDVAIGAPNADAGGNDSGAVYLFYGPVERGDLALADADATFVGASARDRAGFDVAGGDLNGDGVADLIVGVPVHNSSAGTTGAVHVVFGGDAVAGTASLADADATLIGAAPGDEAGYAVGAVANASGGAAVVVGAPGNDTNGDDAGAAYVLDGVSSGDSSLTDAGTVLVGDRAGDRAGFDVAGAGDANGDGAPDVIIGAPNADANGNDSGAAYVVTDALDAGAVGLSEVGIRLLGGNDGDQAGFAVSAAGDLNADGVTDLLVGAPRSDANGNDSGAAHVVYGSAELGDRSLADADATLAGASPGDLAGWSVAGANSSIERGGATETKPGDATCDAIADLLVGAPTADANRNATVGAAYLVGDIDGTTNLSDATATFVGEDDGDFAGSEVAFVTDADDDASDLLVGAPRNDATGNDSGVAYLLASDCPAGQTTTEATTEAPTETTTEGPATTRTTTETPTATTTAETSTTTAETPTTTTTTATTTETTTTATTTATTTESPTETTERRTTASPTESPDATQTPPVDVTQTQVEVVFECTQVSVTADEYDAVVLTFADGTRQSFDGPFTGPQTFAGEDGDVIRSLEIVVDGVSVPVENPVYEQCVGQ